MANNDLNWRSIQADFGGANQASASASSSMSSAGTIFDKIAGQFAGMRKEQEDVAFREKQFDEGIRQFGINKGLAERQLGIAQDKQKLDAQDSLFKRFEVMDNMAKVLDSPGVSEVGAALARNDLEGVASAFDRYNNRLSGSDSTESREQAIMNNNPTGTTTSSTTATNTSKTPESILTDGIKFAETGNSTDMNITNKSGASGPFQVTTSWINDNNNRNITKGMTKESFLALPYEEQAKIVESRVNADAEKFGSLELGILSHYAGDGGIEYLNNPTKANLEKYRKNLMATMKGTPKEKEQKAQEHIDGLYERQIHAKKLANNIRDARNSQFMNNMSQESSNQLSTKLGQLEQARRELQLAPIGNNSTQADKVKVLEKEVVDLQNRDIATKLSNQVYAENPQDLEAAEVRYNTLINKAIGPEEAKKYPFALHDIVEYDKKEKAKQLKTIEKREKASDEDAKTILKRSKDENAVVGTARTIARGSDLFTTLPPEQKATVENAIIRSLPYSGMDINKYRDLDPSWLANIGTDQTTQQVIDTWAGITLDNINSKTLRSNPMLTEVVNILAQEGKADHILAAIAQNNLKNIPETSEEPPPTLGEKPATPPIVVNPYTNTDLSARDRILRSRVNNPLGGFVANAEERERNEILRKQQALENSISEAQRTLSNYKDFRKIAEGPLTWFGPILQDVKILADNMVQSDNEQVTYLVNRFVQERDRILNKQGRNESLTAREKQFLRYTR